MAAGIAAFKALGRVGSDVVWAGHPVGKLTIAALSGCLDEADTMLLARERGCLVAQASEGHPSGMSAVIGGDPDDISPCLARRGLTAANHIGAGQIVAAGRVDDLASLREDPPGNARVRPLQVAGAFHSHIMASAADRFAKTAAGSSSRDPRVERGGCRGRVGSGSCSAAHPAGYFTSALGSDS